MMYYYITRCVFYFLITFNLALRDNGGNVSKVITGGGASVESKESCRYLRKLLLLLLRLEFLERLLINGGRFG
jgi:hypothetical protein